MQITKQVNQNECGICILHSMIQHFHKKDIPTYELITKSNMSTDGLSIYDLEIIGLNYGVVFDSYNATVNELKQIDEKKYFVLVFNIGASTHYVIGKNNKHKNTIKIFCSIDGEYELTWKQLELKWSGIFISCEKSIFNEINHVQAKQLIQINWKYLLLMNCLSLIGIGISIFCSTFMQKITMLLTEDKYMAISLALVFTYLAGYICQYLISWFSELMHKKTVFQNYLRIQHEMWRRTQFKYHSFYNKINYKYLIDMDDYSLLLVDFYYSKLNQYIANAILLLIVVFILATIDLLILVFALGAILLSGAVDFVSYKFQQENWNPAQNEHNDYKNSLIKLIDFLRSNNNYSYEQKLLIRTKNYHKEIKNRYFKTNNFSHAITFIDAVIQIIFFIIICFLGIRLVTEEKMNIGQLLFCITLTQMLTSSAKMLCVLPNSIVQFKHARTVVNNILQVDNINSEKEANVVTDINVITYKNINFSNDTILVGRSGIGKSYCLMRLANLIKGDEEIKFNEISRNDLNDMWFKKYCIYMNQTPQLMEDTILDLYNLKHKEIIFECLNLAQIKNDKIDNLSTGQKQILCFLSLINEHNKVILLDESLSNVNEELKTKILDLIKPIIVKNNFLIYVDHNSNCHKQFAHMVKFDE